MKQPLFQLKNAELSEQFRGFAKKIITDGFPDNVPLLVSRVLLNGRVPKSRGVVLEYCPMKTKRYDDDRLWRSLVYSGSDLYITGVEEDKEEFNRCSTIFDRFFLGKNYEHVDAFDRYLAQNNQDARIYINKEEQKTYVMVRVHGNAPTHYIMTLLPVLLPWFFEEKPVTDEERDLIKSIVEDEPDHFLTCIENMLKKIDIRAENIKSRLEGYTDRFASERERDLKRSIQDYDNKITAYEQTLTGVYKEREQLVEELSGFMMNKKKNTDTSLIDFFTCSKSLKLLDVCGNELSFEINTTLDNYDVDVFESYMGRENGVFNNETNYCGYDLDDGRMLVNAIFSTQKVRVNIRASFVLDFCRGSAHIAGTYTNFTENCINNPHLTAYKCLGNNGPNLSRALRERDYVGALSTCISIAGNLNISEANNDENFLLYLFDSTNKCIKLPDGTDVTVSEAINYLKKGDE